MKYHKWLILLIGFLHKLKKPLGFLEKNWPTPTEYLRERQKPRQAGITKSPTRAIYLRILILVIVNCYTPAYAFNLPSNEVRTNANFIGQIAVVDIPAVLESSIAIQTIRKSIDDISKKIHQDILKQADEFKETESKILEKRYSISETDFNKEVQEFNKHLNIVQKQMRERKLRLAHSHSEAVGKVQQAVLDIINQLAEKYNLDIVISSTQVLFVKHAFNITLEVAEELNKNLKHVEIIYE